MSVLRKRDAKRDLDVPAAELHGGTFAVQYPAVWEMLAAPRYLDETPRLLATLTVFVDDGMVKLCLNDRDQGLTGWAAGVSVQEALVALERALQGDTVEWRAATAKGKKKR